MYKSLVIGRTMVPGHIECALLSGVQLDKIFESFHSANWTNLLTKDLFQ